MVDIAQFHEDGGLEIVQEATEEEERRRSLHEPLEPVTAISEEAIEHGARTADRVQNEALVSSQTMGVLDKFAAPEPTLVEVSPPSRPVRTDSELGANLTSFLLFSAVLEEISPILLSRRILRPGHRQHRNAPHLSLASLTYLFLPRPGLRARDGEDNGPQ